MMEKTKKLVVTLIENEGLDVDKFLNEFTYFLRSYSEINSYIESVAKKLAVFNESYEKRVMDSYWKERIPEDAPNGYICQIEFADYGSDLIYCRNKEDLEPTILKQVKSYDWSIVKKRGRLTGNESLKDLLLRFPDGDIFNNLYIYAIPENTGDLIISKMH
jgi:hypothetical protein